MTRKQALASLIAKVEAGDAKFADTEAVFHGPDTTRYQFENDYVIHAMRGSLDAALALHEAVLPDAWAHVRHTGKYGHCTIDLDGDEYEANNCPHPARAWLLAILKALHAQEGEG